MKTLRAKMLVHTITKQGSQNDNKPMTTQIDIEAKPVTSGKGSEENKSFSQYTPGGVLKLTITNPKAFDFFKEGEEIYVDISSADEAERAAEAAEKK